MYKLIVGNISSERQDDWFRKDENPYAVWEGKSIIEEICIGSTCRKRHNHACLQFSQ